MAGKGFGSDLWKNVSSVRVTRHDGVKAPVRADGTHGIVAGQDAIARREGGTRPERDSSPGLWSRFVTTLRGA
ncbi:hypothetical protein [Nocardioides sp.]|uniref:hypothetical protein n=1 Tax=Nocardioides sp. TaxID=35761 RepID=UPI003528958F